MRGQGRQLTPSQLAWEKVRVKVAAKAASIPFADTISVWKPDEWLALRQYVEANMR
jgi:hypothetical protein